MDLSTLWPIAVALAGSAATYGAMRAEVARLKSDVAKLTDTNLSIRVSALEKAAEKHDDLRDRMTSMEVEVRQMRGTLDRIAQVILKQHAIV